MRTGQCFPARSRNAVNSSAHNGSMDYISLAVGYSSPRPREFFPSRKAATATTHMPPDMETLNPSAFGDWYTSGRLRPTNMTILQRFIHDNTFPNFTVLGNESATRGELRPATMFPGAEIENHSDSEELLIMQWFQYVVVPLIVGLGVSGNTLALVVYVTSGLSRLSCSSYLAALALTDSGFLLCLLVRWLHGAGVLQWQFPLCPLTYYLTGVFSFLSMAYVLGYTTERYIATCWPLRRKTWCTKKRARLLVCVCAVFAILCFTPTLWMFESRIVRSTDFPQCTAKVGYERILKWSCVCTLIFTWIIPTFLTVGLNVRIICAMVRQDARLGRSLGEMSPSRESSPTSFQVEQIGDRASSARVRILKAVPVNRRSHYRITRMLVISSSAFIVLGLPYELLKEYHYFRFNNWSLDDVITHPDYTLPYKAVVVCIYHLYYLNFGVDFFIYNVAGSNFREAFRSVLRKAFNNLQRKCGCISPAPAGLGSMNAITSATNHGSYYMSESV